MRSASFSIRSIDNFIITAIGGKDAYWVVENIPDNVPDIHVWELFSRLLIEPISVRRGNNNIIIDYSSIQDAECFWSMVSSNLRRIRISLGRSQKDIVLEMGYNSEYESRFGFWEGGRCISSARFSEIIKVYSKLQKTSAFSVLQEIMCKKPESFTDDIYCRRIRRKA